MADENKDTNNLKNFGENLASDKGVRDRALTFVNQQIQDIKSVRGYLENKWVMLDRLWRGEPLSRFYPSGSTTNVPEPFKAVESIVPRLKEALFPSSEWFRVGLMEDGVGDPEAIRVLLTEQLRDAKFDYNFTLFLRSMCIMGTAFAKCPYVTEMRKFFMNERSMVDVQSGRETVSRREGPLEKREFKVDRSRTEFLPLDIFDFYSDPRYDDLSMAPGNGDVSIHNREYVLKNLKEGIYAGITEKELDELGRRQANSIISGGDLRYTAIDASEMKRDPKDDIKVLEWWGLFDPKGDGERVECVISLLNQERCVRVQENRLWHQRRPYLREPYTPIQGQLYGLGLIEPIVWLCQDLNDMRNTVNAAAALVANPMLKVGDDANVEDEQITASPGKILRCSDVTQVQVLAEPDMTGVARMSEVAAKQDINETLGTTRLGYGGETGSQETATATFTRARESNSRIKEVIKNIAYDVLAPFLEMAHYNNHQFMNENRVVVMTGDAKNYLHFKVTPDKLAGPARFDILLAPQIELLGVRGQQMMMFLERVSNNPILASAVTPAGMLRTIWEDMFGDRDIYKVFPPTPDEEDISQFEENMVMQRGVEVNVRKWHNHKEHLRLLNMYMMTPEFGDLLPDVQGLLMSHANNHDIMLKREAQKQPPPMPMMPAGGGGGSGGIPQMVPPGVEARNDDASAIAQMLADESRGRVQGG
jgi:hypothetical protein